MSNMLLIEVDGGYHGDQEQKKYDEARTGLLNELGYEVIRFSNEEIINNTNKAVAVIRKLLDERKNAGVQSPLSVRRGARGEGKGP